jgi:hypothetical protein
MAVNQDLLSAIDLFVQTEKEIVGTVVPYEWAAGRNKHELKMGFPINVDGELIPDARLEVTALPQRPGIQFRISLCYGAAICRLDHTDETHANSQRDISDNIPAEVTGHHWHSWDLNRRFFQGANTAPELKNAVSFESKGIFDSNLRWFCAEMRIVQPPGHHVIELPPKGSLF